MDKVYILVSTFIDEELGSVTISDIKGVFANYNVANHSLQCLKHKTYLRLDIIEQPIIS